MSFSHLRHASRARVERLRLGKPLPLAMLRGELLVGASYVVAALAFAIRDGVHGVPLSTAALYTVAMAIAVNVRFDIGARYTVPVQAVFVPMLFAVTPAAIPLLMPLGLALGMAPRIVHRQLGPSWLLTSLGNGWFALGPALLLALAGTNHLDRRWPLLFGALCSQFAFDLATNLVRERLYGDMTVREVLNEFKPIYAMDCALSTLGLAIAYSALLLHTQLAVLLVAPLFAILQFFSAERRERLEQLAVLNDAYQGTALLLGDFVEADDTYTGEHCRGVVRLALAVAEVLGLDARRKRTVEFGALLHDVGKIAVPKEIINKPGKLDEREWEIMRTHTIEGQRMLERIGGLMLEIGRIVRGSHERWDGGGYPDGLAGEQIPLESRIVSTCDAYNAMTTTRSYRKALPEAEAREELRRCAGTQFDPRVVKALLSVIERSDREAGPGALDAAGLGSAPVPATSEASVLVGVAQPLAG